MTDIEMLPLPDLYMGTKLIPYEERTFRMAKNRESLGYTSDPKELYSAETVKKIVAARDAEIEALRAEVEKLRELCGCAYQMAGYHDAPVEWLDALGDAGDGTPLDEWRVQAKDLSDVLLPYQPDNNSHEDAEVDRLRRGNKRLAEALRIAEAALADIGDADREPGDDVAWCERRAALGLRRVRDTLRDHDKETTNDR